MKEVSSLQAEMTSVVNSSDSLLQQNGDRFVFLRNAQAQVQVMDRDRGMDVRKLAAQKQWAQGADGLDARGDLTPQSLRPSSALASGSARVCFEKIQVPRSRAEIHDGVRSLSPLANPIPPFLRHAYIASSIIATVDVPSSLSRSFSFSLSLSVIYGIQLH